MRSQSPRLIKSTTARGLGFSLLRCQAQPRNLFHSSTRYFFNRTPAIMSKEFLCILPDKPGAQAKRLEVRSQHLEGVKPLVDAGKVVVGGAMFNNAHPAEGETPSFKGSMLIYTVETEEDAWELIRNDIYVKSGVWNLDAAQVIPFKSAVRVAA